MERTEIYPFQRVPEAATLKSSRRRIAFQPAAHFNIHRLRGFIAGFAGIVKPALTPWNLILASIGLIMARAFVLGELLPFVFAFLVAFGRADLGRTILLTTGAVAGLFTVNTGLQLWANLFSVAGIIWLARSVRIPSNRQWWLYPMAAAVCLIVVKGVFTLISGPSFYQGMVVTFEALIAGVLTFVFNVAGEAIQEKKSLSRFQFDDIAAFVIVSIGFAMGLNDIAVAGINAGSVFCRLSILVAAYLWGSGAATMVGVMAGLIPSLSSSIFAQFLGMHAFAGLLAGLFRSIGRLGIMMGFLLGNLALAMFVPDTQMNILGIWETAIACGLFILIPAAFRDRMPVALAGIGGTGDSKVDEVTNWEKGASAHDRIQELAGLFESLSTTFENPGGNKDGQEDVSYLHYLYDQVSQGFCQTCAHHHRCWGPDCYQTSQEILEIFALAESDGAISYDDCPKTFQLKCPHSKDILNTIQYLFDNLRINEYWCGKLQESRSLVAKQLTGISQIMRNLAREMEAKPQVDSALRERLLTECHARGIEVKDIRPWYGRGGQLAMDVYVKACRSGRGCEDTLVPALSSMLGDPLVVAEKKCLPWSGEICQITLTRSNTYNVRYGAAQVGKEAVCGDSFTVATLKEGKQLVALSDGMGVGENASRESQAAVHLLENLLAGGFSRDMALQTINSVLLLRSRKESFATLDLVMIDLFTGQGDFIKTGSAPTFIKRKGLVQVIISQSWPMGILDEVEIFSDQRNLLPGDIIVMVSDGVVEAAEQQGDSYWIEGVLRVMDAEDPQMLAESILHRALGLCHGKPLDDMSVICLQMERNLGVATHP